MINIIKKHLWYTIYTWALSIISIAPWIYINIVTNITPPHKYIPIYVLYFIFIFCVYIIGLMILEKINLFKRLVCFYQKRRTDTVRMHDSGAVYDIKIRASSKQIDDLINEVDPGNSSIFAFENIIKEKGYKYKIVQISGTRRKGFFE